MDVTIKDLSDLLGVTKTSIRRYMQTIPKEYIKHIDVDGVKMVLISAEGAEAITDLYRAKHPVEHPTKHATTDGGTGSTDTGTPHRTQAKDVPQRSTCTETFTGTKVERSDLLQVQIGLYQDRITDLKHDIEQRDEQIKQLSDRLAEALQAIANLTAGGGTPAPDPEENTPTKRPWWRRRQR